MKKTCELRSAVTHVKQSARKKQADMTAEERLKVNARAYANVYQRRGKLIPMPCEKCGAQKSQKHHEDYSKPLEVRWLCRSCHMTEHGGSPRGKRTTKCSRCDQPRMPSLAYCRDHHAAYQREWRKARAEELRRLRALVSGGDSHA